MAQRSRKPQALGDAHRNESWTRGALALDHAGRASASDRWRTGECGTTSAPMMFSRPLVSAAPVG
jgi:hypothetical protein